MDPLTSAVTVSQTVAYCSALAVRLVELYNIAKNSRQIFQEYRSSIDLLHRVVCQLLAKDDFTVAPEFCNLLDSVEQTVKRLLGLFSQSKRRKTIVLLLTQQRNINAAFTTLEHQKTTLLLYLSAENFSPSAPMPTPKTKSKKAECQTSDSRGLRQKFLSKASILHVHTEAEPHITRVAEPLTPPPSTPGLVDSPPSQITSDPSFDDQDDSSEDSPAPNINNRNSITTSHRSRVSQVHANHEISTRRSDKPCTKTKIHFTTSQIIDSNETDDNSIHVALTSPNTNGITTSICKNKSTKGSMQILGNVDSATTQTIVMAMNRNKRRDT